MQVFIQVSLGLAELYPFGQPVLQGLKARLPTVITLDIDAASDEMLVTQACRLLQEADQVMVYFKVAAPNAAVGVAFRLVEEIIRENKPFLILLEGTHTRLASIFKARPHLQIVAVSDASKIPDQLGAYFQPR